MATSPRMLVSDLDGTLLFSGKLGASDTATFAKLGDAGVIRTIATGRSWTSTRKVVPPEFPLDYLVFSSGAGIVDWKTGELLLSHNLTADHARQATQTFLEHGLDLMVHDPIPQATGFFYHRGTGANPDYDQRLALHAAHGRPLELAALGAASQVLGICPKGDPEHPYQTLRSALPEMTVIRATSPLDGRSLWLEAFSSRASKSQGAHWVARRHGVEPADVLAVGNDYNDWDLLEWAGTSYVLDNAPVPVQRAFATLPAADLDGVTRAVAQWFK